jgi:hypothetical protein
MIAYLMQPFIGTGALATTGIPVVSAVINYAIEIHWIRMLKNNCKVTSAVPK